MMLWLIYVLTAIGLLSANTFLVKHLVKKVTVPVLLFYQFLLAMPLVGLYALLSGASAINAHGLMIIGFFYVIALSAYYVALHKGALSKASPVFSMQMLITVILGVAVLSEGLSITKLIGITLGVIGIFLIGGAK